MPHPVQAPYNSNTMHVQCKNKRDTSNNRGDWNHFKIVQTVVEQQTGESAKLGIFFIFSWQHFRTNMVTFRPTKLQKCKYKCIKVCDGCTIISIRRKRLSIYNIYTYIYTECPRRNVPDFGRVFLMLKYTDITQNTYIQS